MKPWYIGFEVVCPSEQLLFRELQRCGTDVIGISRSGGVLRFSVVFTQRRRVEGILDRLKAEHTVCSRGALVRTLDSVKHRLGLAVGSAVCLAALITVQNFVINIEVLSDDPEIQKRVAEVLHDCGVEPGAYIPDIERAKTERQLRQTVEGISWAGITLTDCTVIVDVLDDIPEPKRADDHYPTDLVAKYDAVVDKLEILNGAVVEPVGSGVVAGEVLVSGRVPVERTTRDDEGRPVIERSEKYVRSIGSVYGSFTLTESFTQPLSETKLVYSPKREKRYSLQLFSTEIPLYLSDPDGMVSIDEKLLPLKILGEKAPVGLKTCTYTPYSFQTVRYTPEQAEKLARDHAKKYERNFLDSYEIRGRSEKLEKTADGATLTVTYELYGVISEERAFYIFDENKGSPDEDNASSSESE